jgi:cytosine/adenosine deaminase-related metal-dependent hydrolase
MASIVLRGGRVIDPESGMDEIADVEITGAEVTRVGASPRTGTPRTGSPRTGSPRMGDAAETLDVTGLVVTAGFIDLHSHAASIAGGRLQAMDGVTTALELEAGASPVGAAYQRAAAHGRPVNYGFAASWGLTRMEAVAGIRMTDDLGAFLANIANPAWQRPASAGQLRTLLARLEEDLADGALGIGVLLGYAPHASPQEYLRVAALAAAAGAPVFTHARDLIEMVPGTLIDGAEEIVGAAEATGAHMHYCHVNSTSQRHIARVLETVGRAQRAGARVSTEAYPYGSGMTGIGAAFLAPERLAERGLTPDDLTYAPTGERVGTQARLRELRRADPGGLAIIRTLDEDDPADRDLLGRSLDFPGGVIASDAMPLTWPGVQEGHADQDLAWPLPATVITHPRTAGTFARTLRLNRDRAGGPLPLADVLAKCSLLAARVLEDRVPGMRRKGRLRAGGDADIVVFDPAGITDQATYAASTRPSTGIRHVLVNGTFVVRDGELRTDARPGRPVRG